MAESEIVELGDSGPLRIGQDFAGCRVLGALGRGASGFVYRGVETSAEMRPVAIKVVPPKPGPNRTRQIDRAVREAQHLSKLDHPNIVKVFRAGATQSGAVFMIMPLLEGMPLDGLLHRLKHLSPSEALLVGVQVSSAMSAAHAVGLVHRDLKPANIHILPDNRVVVLDFGIAKSSEFQTTERNVCRGTPLYMAPEYLLTSMSDTRSDVYSLGVVLYEIMSGINPFDKPEGAVFEYVSRAQIDLIPPLLSSIDPGIPHWIAKAVARTLEKLPEDRPQTMEELRRQLVSLAASEYFSVIDRTGLAPVPRQLVAAARASVAVENAMSDAALQERATANLVVTSELSSVPVKTITLGTPLPPRTKLSPTQEFDWHGYVNTLSVEATEAEQGEQPHLAVSEGSQYRQEASPHSERAGRSTSHRVPWSSVLRWLGQNRRSYVFGVAASIAVAVPVGCGSRILLASWVSSASRNTESSALTHSSAEPFVAPKRKGNPSQPPISVGPSPSLSAPTVVPVVSPVVDRVLETPQSAPLPSSMPAASLGRSQLRAVPPGIVAPRRTSAEADRVATMYGLETASVSPPKPKLPMKAAVPKASNTIVGASPSSSAPHFRPMFRTMHD